jgi:hypothetical protein
VHLFHYAFSSGSVAAHCTVAGLSPGSLHSWVGSADTLQVRESLAILWIQSESRLIVSGGSNEIPFAFKNSCPHHVRGF